MASSKRALSLTRPYVVTYMRLELKNTALFDFAISACTYKPESTVLK